MKHVLESKDLFKSYGKVQALRGVSFSMDHGVYALLGPNGSGKSTLMNVIAGLLKPTAGEVLFHGEPLGAKRTAFYKQFGYMPQYPAVYPSFSVLEFLQYVSVLKCLPDDGGKEIEALLERVELSDVKDRRISALSGGMKQRLSLCSAVLGDPELLILDEPTAGLDPMQRVALRRFVGELGERKTVLWATHIVSDVESIAKEIIFMKQGVATVQENSAVPLEERYLAFFGDLL
ncbi:MAG: ATP-binding cassette domain-containing protein [Clostridia bacterium]|nr:ATP-binding cassette domain-containing protein [Clostridia bacterium]